MPSSKKRTIVIRASKRAPAVKVRLSAPERERVLAYVAKKKTKRSPR